MAWMCGSRLFIGGAGRIRDHRGGCQGHVARGLPEFLPDYTVRQRHEANEQQPDEGATDQDRTVEHGRRLKDAHTVIEPIGAECHAAATVGTKSERRQPAALGTVPHFRTSDRALYLAGHQTGPQAAQFSRLWRAAPRASARRS